MSACIESQIVIRDLTVSVKSEILTQKLSVESEISIGVEILERIVSLELKLIVKTELLIIEEWDLTIELTIELTSKWPKLVWLSKKLALIASLEISKWSVEIGVLGKLRLLLVIELSLELSTKLTVPNIGV